MVREDEDVDGVYFLLEGEVRCEVTSVLES